MTIALTDLGTLAVGLGGLVVASTITTRIPVLSRMNVPIPVLGGLLVAIVAGLLNQFGGTPIQFDTRLTDFFLLVFFTTVGLSAKLSALKEGGRPLVILCVVTVLLLVVQNVLGILVASVVGVHPFYGLLIGSVSFVGGPGTAAAWAKEAQAMGLEHAPEVAVSAATLAVIVGAVIAGPITGWLIKRHKLQGPTGQTPAGWVAPKENQPTPAVPIASVMQVLLLIMVAVIAGNAVNEWARQIGFVLPGFLTAMLAGAVIANVGDALHLKIEFAPVDRGGEIALQAFLVMYLMSLNLWGLGSAIGPLAANLAIQVLVTTMIGVLLLFRWLGRDYDAAVTVGGFLGFGLSSMPVAMSTMDSVTSRYGPSPKAFLLITLAGSFFVDLANAFIVKGFLALPALH
jgi:ESS family glutamate:Na+ symporter